MLYLRDLPVTSIKIDREFITGVDRNPDDRAIVTSLLSLAQSVGLTSVAEGVETRSQAGLLRALGCQYAQGYLWSPPVPVPELMDPFRAGLIPPLAPESEPESEPMPMPPLTSDIDPLDRARQMLAQGATLHTIAAALNADGLRTDRGRRWHPTSVAHLITRGAPPQVR